MRHANQLVVHPPARFRRPEVPALVPVLFRVILGFLRWFFCILQWCATQHTRQVCWLTLWWQGKLCTLVILISSDSLNFMSEDLADTEGPTEGLLLVKSASDAL
jgi:hypothetical protein